MNVRTMSLAGAVLLVALNLDFYRFLLHRRGLLFAVLSFFMHMLYYFYSGLAFERGPAPG